MEGLKRAWSDWQILLLGQPSSVGLSHRRLSDTVRPTKPFWFRCPLCFPNVLVGCPHQVYMP